MKGLRLRKHIEEAQRKHADSEYDQGNHRDEQPFIFAASIKKLVKHGKPPNGKIVHSIIIPCTLVSVPLADGYRAWQ